jgi:hypothetical protein
MRINRVAGLKRLVILAAALGLLSLANPAAAQYITYVAANGNDANPCVAVTAPCKTLQRGVNVTPANGTVRVLTPLQSSVFINKSITIEGARPTIVGQITINSATAVVTLRGLALNGVGGYVNGIRIDSAAAVRIEDVTVERYTGEGIKLGGTTATELFVSNTASHDNLRGLFVDAANARVAVENSSFDNNAGVGLYIFAAASANIVRTAASGNSGSGFYFFVSANITEATASNNATNGFGFDNGANATLASSVARSNYYGVFVAAGAAVTITDCVITSNSGAITNSGTLYTRQNNTVGGTVSGNPLQALGAL